MAPWGFKGQKFALLRAGRLQGKLALFLAKPTGGRDCQRARTTPGLADAGPRPPEEEINHTKPSKETSAPAEGR